MEQTELLESLIKVALMHKQGEEKNIYFAARMAQRAHAEIINLQEQVITLRKIRDLESNAYGGRYSCPEE